MSGPPESCKITKFKTPSLLLVVLLVVQPVMKTSAYPDFLERCQTRLGELELEVMMTGYLDRRPHFTKALHRAVGNRLIQAHHTKVLQYGAEVRDHREVYHRAVQVRARRGEGVQETFCACGLCLHPCKGFSHIYGCGADNNAGNMLL